MVQLDRSTAATGTSPLRRSPKSAEHQSDPIVPWLRAIEASVEDFKRDPEATEHKLKTLIEDCIKRYADDDRYRNDVRFLKIWVIYGDVIQDFRRIFRMLEVKGICQAHSLLYEAYAIFLISKGELVEASNVYELGISRHAEPLDRLKEMYSAFLERVIAITSQLRPTVSAALLAEQERGCNPNPWSCSTINGLLQSMDMEIRKYNGFHRSAKAYPGKVSLASLKKFSRNQIIELGGRKYYVKGCTGSGKYAQVFKAFVDNNSDDVVALKIQNPPFPWEFYLYRQLDKRIPEQERQSFGFAHKVHIYTDWSILVCDFLSHGTLQDAINFYLLKQKVMEEVLCVYYTIEMLRMLEALHTAGIIHGDFKPDNLLVRCARDTLLEDDFMGRAGAWRDQGLCLVDWGRGVDVNLFPASTEFLGDCRTSGFQCIQMQEKQTWTYQVDTYGLCVIVHMMLFGSYMTVEKKKGSDGNYRYQPKSPFKRYWNVYLWEKLFSSLLNNCSCENDVVLLANLRKSFESYMCEKPQRISELRNLLAKQKSMLCSA